MWEKIGSYFAALVFLQQKTAENSRDIAKLQEQMERLIAQASAQDKDLQRVEQIGAERDKRILLEVENMLLKFERRLPPATKNEGN